MKFKVLKVIIPLSIILLGVIACNNIELNNKNSNQSTTRASDNSDQKVEKSGSSDLSNEKNISNENIDLKLNNLANTVDPNILISSNPFDYIKGIQQNEDYKFLVSSNEQVLNYMLNKFEISNTDGLVEYLMAIVCSDILNEPLESKNWTSGRDWYNQYVEKTKQ